MTIFRSSEFDSEKRHIPLLNEDDEKDDFPLLDIQPAIANTSHAVNAIGINSISATLVLSHGRDDIFSSEYGWYLLAVSDAVPDKAGNQIISFLSAESVSPFALPSGQVWTREIILIPSATYKKYDWSSFAAVLGKHCVPPDQCNGTLTMTIKTTRGTELRKTCNFALDSNGVGYLTGTKPRRRLFSADVCK